MLKRSPMKPGAGFKPRTTTLKSNAFVRAEKKEAAASSKAARGMKTKQRAVSPTEKLMWDRLAQLGCIACMKDGHYNPHVSIHHVDGRTKPGCHEKVLPLCGPHHQDDGSGTIAVHPWKARFEAKYGTQEELVAMCQQLLKGRAAPSVEQGAAPIKTITEKILNKDMIPEHETTLATEGAQP